MRKTVQLALMGSLMVAAASPLALAGDEPSAAPTEPVQLADNGVSIVPLPVYQAQAQPGKPVRFWSI